MMAVMANIRYLVDDVETCVAFYTQHLGFEVKERWGPFIVIVTREDLSLWLSGPQTSAAKPMPDGRKPIPGGWNRLVIVVKDTVATAATLRAAGVTFRNEVLTGPGGSQVLIEDPSGNPIELFTPAG
jgi:catechol 2,3-dioxygenase-like lactoylglutathione lyase family enzyme